MKNSQKIILKSLEDTKKVAKEIANELETYIKTKSLIIFLKGELGSGKTTLTKEILKRLGILEPVTSPTFTIIEPYSIKNKKIYHMDLYRIENRKELEVLGIEEYLNENESFRFHLDILQYLKLLIPFDFRSYINPCDKFFYF